MYFTYGMEHSQMKINFTHEIFILHMELKQIEIRNWIELKQ